MRVLCAATAVALVTALIGVPALAGKGGPAPTLTIKKNDRDEKKVFVGLNWNFAARDGLTAVLGYRWARVDKQDKVVGGLADITMPVTGDAAWSLGEIHIKGLAGARTVQGELGLGYSFERSAFVVNGGVRAPYVNAGVDYLIGQGFMPYVGVDSLGRPSSHTERKVLTCPAGFTVSGNTCVVSAPPP